MAVRGLYRRWGIAPRPEERFSFLRWYYITFFFRLQGLFPALSRHLPAVVVRVQELMGSVGQRRLQEILIALPDGGILMRKPQAADFIQATFQIACGISPNAACY